jgi:hypothetical protein
VSDSVHNRRASSETPAWRKPDVLAIAALLVLTLIVVWHLWVFDNWLARHDLLTFFLPWLGALGDRLSAFDVPALNRYVFSGSPFAGDPESGWMYAPAMLFFPFFEVTVAYKLMILALLLLAGTSTYALARLLGYGALAALFSAVAFEFGPYLYGQTHCCTVATNTSAFIPLAFLGVEIALRTASWSTRLAGWVIGGFAISQFFAAWLGQGTVIGLVFVASWVVFRGLITPVDPKLSLRTRLVRMTTTGLGVLAIGLLLGAAGLLPRLAANMESNNSGGTYENTPGASERRFDSLAIALTRLLVDETRFRSVSVWGTVFVLMVAAVLLSRRRSVIPYFAVVAVVIPALGMGTRPISDLFFLIPRFEEIHRHSPDRVLWLHPFIAAMLAGGAVNELPRLPSMRLKWLVAVVPLTSVVIASWYVNRERDVDIGKWTWTGAILATLVLLLVAASPRLPSTTTRIRTMQSLAVLLIASAFLLPNGLAIAKTLKAGNSPPGELILWANDAWVQEIIHQSLRRDDPGGAAEFLQSQQETEPPFRFIAYGGMYHPDTILRSYPNRRLEPAMVAILQNARPMRLGLETTQGYNPLQPLVYQEFVHALNGREQDYHYANLLYTGVDSPLLDLLNVRYIVVDRAIPESRDDHQALARSRIEVYRDENVIIYESPEALPRAWMVYDVRSANDGEGLARLASGEADGSEIAFVHGDIPTVSPPDDGGEPRVTVTNWTPDGMTMDVTQIGNGLLVVSEIYSDAWQASVDGRPAEVIRTDHALLGISVGPGEHTIVISYKPRSLEIGLWISGLSAIVACIVLVVALARALPGSLTRLPWRRTTAPANNPPP